MRRTSAINIIIFVYELNILLSVRHCYPQDSNAPQTRIIGGSATTITSVPYLVNIRVNGKFICGGSLITKLHVLTAAHCVHGLVPNTVIVTGGVTYLTEFGVRRGVQKIITPRSYNKQTMSSDVSVLKLSEEMRGLNIATIDLCSTEWSIGQNIQVSGWGQVIETESPASNVVRSISIPLIAHSSCALKYKHVAQITSTMFCASEPGLRDACTGDSGGPAVYKNQLCGIVSWGVGCARKNYPGVYTNVKKVKAFIRKALSE